MILNISGRTDVLAFYSKWLINRFKEGFVDVRNPFNQYLVSRIYFEDVDAILFCTKNPLPIIDYLPNINKPILFHITLTPYKKDIEPQVPDKKLIIEAIKKISKIVGIENTYVRYDPVFLSEKYNLEYHKKAFEKMCTLLEDHVKKIIISFIDEYKNVKRNMHILKYRPFEENDYKEIGLSFAESTRNHGMTVQTCFEKRNLTEYGFIKQDCVTKEMMIKLTNKSFKKWTARKEKNCNCVQMVDIGAYNSCSHYCKYCYANFDEKRVIENTKKHNPQSSLLIGELTKKDTIKKRIT